MTENQEEVQAAQAHPEKAQGADETEAKAERWKQQLRWRELQAKKALMEQSAAEQRAERYKKTLAASIYSDGEINKKALSKIAEEDPDMADEIARGYQIGDRAARSAQELLDSVPSDDESTKKVPAANEDAMLEKLSARIVGQLQNDRAIDEVEKMFSELPATSRESAAMLFRDITDGKKNLTPDQAKRYANMVIRDLWVEPKKSPTRKISSMASVGLGNASYQAPRNDDSFSDDEFSQFLQSAGPRGVELAKLIKLK